MGGWGVGFFSVRRTRWTGSGVAILLICILELGVFNNTELPGIEIISTMKRGLPLPQHYILVNHYASKLHRRPWFISRPNGCMRVVQKLVLVDISSTHPFNAISRINTNREYWRLGLYNRKSYFIINGELHKEIKPLYASLRISFIIYIKHYSCLITKTRRQQENSSYYYKWPMRSNISFISNPDTFSGVLDSVSGFSPQKERKYSETYSGSGKYSSKSNHPPIRNYPPALRRIPIAFVLAFSGIGLMVWSGFSDRRRSVIFLVLGIALWLCADLMLLSLGIRNTWDWWF